MSLDGKGGERRLPQNLEAERCVLGALLLDCASSMAALQILVPRDFYSTRHLKIFEVIAELYNQLSAVDPILVQESLQRRGIAEEVGGLDYLTELVDAVPTVANAEYHARIVREKSILRNLSATCTELVQTSYESDENAQAQLDRAEQRVFEIGQSGSTRDFVEISEVIHEQFQQHEHQQTVGLMSGFRDL